MAALNVDRFKHIADSLGHPMADSFLQRLAERLAHTMHDRDTLSRSGPNDFLVLLPELRGSRERKNHPETAHGRTGPLGCREITLSRQFKRRYRRCSEQQRRGRGTLAAR